MKGRLGWLGGLLGCAIALVPLQVRSISVADGTVFFEQPPQLVKAVTDFKNTHNRLARYTFVVKVPEAAGEPLQRLILEQTQGVDHIDFRLQRTRAYDGQRRDIPVTASMNAQDQLEVAFEQPVQPGDIVTLKLRPEHNPQSSGVYLFGITAFPEGAKAHGQFLGFGRLHFFSTGGRGRI